MVYLNHLDLCSESLTRWYTGWLRNQDRGRTSEYIYFLCWHPKGMLFLSYSIQQILLQFFIIQHVCWIKITRSHFGLGSSQVIFFFWFCSFYTLQTLSYSSTYFVFTFLLDFVFHLVAFVDKFLKKKLKNRRDSNPVCLDTVRALYL